MGIKTRTRNLVSYLRSQFSDRFEFFIEARTETTDVVHIGDRNNFKNFEVEIDYTMNRVVRYLKKGVQVFANLAVLEKWLGRERRVRIPTWAAAKVLKVKKQIERLMTKKNQKTRKVHPQSAGHVMSFTF